MDRIVVRIKDSLSLAEKDVGLLFFLAQHLIPIPIPNDIILKTTPTKYMLDDWIFTHEFGCNMLDSSFHSKLPYGHVSIHEFS